MTEGIQVLTAPDGARLTLQALPGRGWRCCRLDQAPHTYVPSHSTLRAALMEALPEMDEADPWLIRELSLHAPEELPGRPVPEELSAGSAPGAASAASGRRPVRADRVLIAGSGFAALEAALALRRFASRRARIELLSPWARLSYLPEATAAAFGAGPDPDHALDALLQETGATWHPGVLAEVDPARRRVTTGTGHEVAYDRLIVAVGAQRLPAFPGSGAVTFGGPADVPAVRAVFAQLLRGAASGVSSRLAIVVPAGPSWSLPAYELALLGARHVARHGAGADVSITVVTAEERPLAALGDRAGGAIAAELEAAGVQLVTGHVMRGWALGEVVLLPSGRVRADRVIAVARLRGPAIPGLPSDDLGFIRADRWGRVQGVPDVFVAGDAGPFPIKQGGLACQQADTVASLIAAELGAPVEPIPFEPVLRTTLWTGERPVHMRAPMPPGRAIERQASGGEELWWPAVKVAGRFLSPFLAGRRGNELADVPTSPGDGPPTA